MNISDNDFEYRPDMTADEIPSEPAPLELLPCAAPVKNFVRVPFGHLDNFSPRDRLLLMILFCEQVYGADADSGWVRLTTGRCADFKIHGHPAKKRATQSLETAGIIEVRRIRGRTSLARLTRPLPNGLARRGTAFPPRDLKGRAR